MAASSNLRLDVADVRLALWALFFEWLTSGRAPIVPAAYVGRGGETVLRERMLRLQIAPARQAVVEIVRFAAANRLCVELDYRSETSERTTRFLEPYSLRQ